MDQRYGGASELMNGSYTEVQALRVPAGAAISQVYIIQRGFFAQMATKRKLVSMREYARRRGVTTEAVSKAVKTGRISLVGKKVDVQAADRDWAANTQPGQMAAKKTRKAPKKGAKRTQAAPKEGQPVGDSTVNNYANARARREDYLARMAEVDFEERAGKLVDANEMKAAWMKLITEAKTRLLSVPIKCKSRLPALSALDVSIIENLIRDELEELSG